MAEPQKDTIYIDIDDEITTIIDKLQASSNKVVALVLPKRASALQSIVNMKLLKRAGEQAKKNLVLITTESSLMPLAGAVGLHVAKTPTSRPEIPTAPAAASTDEEQVDEIDLDDEVAPPISPATAASMPVGDLAAATMPLPMKPQAESGVETLELDNTTPDAPLAAAALGKSKTPKPKKDKKLHVPDFNRFRLLLILGGILLLLLIVGGYFALVVLPKASISIKTNASNVNTNVDFSLSTKSTDFSPSSKIVPAKQVQSQKTLTGTSAASGQKNTGDKATGSITLSSGCANGLQTIPAGTGLSANGLTYITQKSITMNSASGGFGSNCKFTGSGPIVAQSGGTKFNTNDGTKFTVSKSGSGSYDASTINATGSADGGTDDIQTVVSQSDIDSAKGKIANSGSSAQQELQKQLQDEGLYAITATYNASDPAITSSANVGDEASNVTVTETITYTMLGANMADIKALVDGNIKNQIDTSHQDILNEGITQGSFKLVTATTNGAAMNIQTTAVVGPSLNTATIAKQAAGKKAGDIKADISGATGVTDVQVKLSPFWVNKAPKNVNKITVTIAKPTNTANGN